ncbi:DUF6382 domain-containing protein [Catenibacillus scindens]|uniref:DUF6382 domain-containing protein n=1 Tax=Catenibacillus scindens TaxID=673271 RepID=UPI0032088CC3
MKMSAMRTEQELYHTYLVLEPGEKMDKGNYIIHILQNNTLNFFLPFQLRSRDGMSSYYYDVPSDESLEKQLEKGFREEQLENFASGLINALDEIEEYLLDENDLFLEPSGIFMTREGGYRFIYYPGYGMDFPSQLQNLASLFLKYVDYTCASAVRHVYSFYHITCRGNTSVKNLREFKLNFGKDLSGVKNRVPESMSAFERKIEDASEAETEVPIVEPSGMANTFQEQNLKKCDRKAGDSHEENKNSILWVIAAACAVEAGIGAVIVKLWSVPALAGVAAVGVIIAITAVSGILYSVFTCSKKQEDDFWKPEDYVPPFFSAGKGEETQDTGGKTTVLSPKRSGARLHSRNPQLWGDLYILNFPMVIGKEASDTSGRIALPTISRRHARLERMGDTFYLTDLRSSNGTYINGEMIEPLSPVGLHSGDSVIFSDVEFTFEILEGKE